MLLFEAKAPPQQMAMVLAHRASLGSAGSATLVAAFRPGTVALKANAMCYQSCNAEEPWELHLLMMAAVAAAPHA
jgi:hypothetical protein